MSLLMKHEAKAEPTSKKIVGDAMEKQVRVERVEMETPYGDRYVLRDKFINVHGDIVHMWHTEKTGTVTGSPESKVAAGHKILGRGMVTEVYKVDDKGKWSR